MELNFGMVFLLQEKNIYGVSLSCAQRAKSAYFSREGQKFTFTEEKTKRGMISEMVAENQLFFSVACTMNDSPCISAMHWYRNHVFFSRDYSDIPKQLLAYSEDKNNA